MKKIILILFPILCIEAIGQSKADSISTESGEIFTLVDESASFPGGLTGWSSYLNEDLKYPALAQKMGIEGRVFVQFIIEKDGRLSDILVVKGIGAGCDVEAIRILRDGPNWIPAKSDGIAVRQKMIQNILFKIADPKTDKQKKRAAKRAKKGN